MHSGIFGSIPLPDVPPVEDAFPSFQSIPAQAEALLATLEPLFGEEYTVHEVAELAGLSDTTASRWLNPVKMVTLTWDELLEKRTHSVIGDEEFKVTFGS